MQSQHVIPLHRPPCFSIVSPHVTGQVDANTPLRPSSPHPPPTCSPPLSAVLSLGDIIDGQATEEASLADLAVVQAELDKVQCCSVIKAWCRQSGTSRRHT